MWKQLRLGCQFLSMSGERGPDTAVPRYFLIQLFLQEEVSRHVPRKSRFLSPFLVSDWYECRQQIPGWMCHSLFSSPNMVPRPFPFRVPMFFSIAQNRMQQKTPQKVSLMSTSNLEFITPLPSIRWRIGQHTTFLQRQMCCSRI